MNKYIVCKKTTQEDRFIFALITVLFYCHESCRNFVFLSNNHRGNPPLSGRHETSMNQGSHFTQKEQKYEKLKTMYTFIPQYVEV